MAVIVGERVVVGVSVMVGVGNFVAGAGGVGVMAAVEATSVVIVAVGVLMLERAPLLIQIIINPSK